MNGFLALSLSMAILLVAGSVWMVPRDEARLDPGTRFDEIAARAGRLNRHTMVSLSPLLAPLAPRRGGAGVRAGSEVQALRSARAK